jgi:hypothetical protein
MYWGWSLLLGSLLGIQTPALKAKPCVPGGLGIIALRHHSLTGRALSCVGVSPARSPLGPSPLDTLISLLDSQHTLMKQSLTHSQLRKHRLCEVTHSLPVTGLW